MSTEDQLPQGDQATHDSQMPEDCQTLDLSNKSDNDQLSYDWEESETLRIVKTFPISDYGTKSDQSSTDDFLVPEPPSLSGIIDSTISSSSSSKTTTVEENYIEDDMSSLTNVSNIEVSDAPRKQEYAKERVEREGNVYDKLYNACLKGQTSAIRNILDKYNTILEEDGQTPLVAACIGNHPEVVKLLIEYGYDVNHQDSEGKTPLHFAFENHAPDLAKILIAQFRARIEIRDSQGWTPLHTAIDRGYFNYSKQLVQKFLTQDATTEISWIQLLAACSEENTQDAQFLVDANADVNHISSAGHTPLHIAVSKGNITLVTLLLHQNIDVNSLTIDRQTPLHIAVDKGNEIIIQNLLAKKADPTLKDALGNTSLHLAVQLKKASRPSLLVGGTRNDSGDRCPIPASYSQCSIQTVQAIIDHGADVDVVNNRGQTALWFACFDGQMDLVKLLLNTGSDPNIADKNGDSILHSAMYGCCSTETVQAIIDHGARINVVNKDKATPLLLACSTAQRESVRLLLGTKADPNIADADGDTSLHAAVAADSSNETLQEILDYGADVNAVNKRGRTALLLSCFYRQVDSVNVLLKAGAKPTLTDKEGFSCLHAAIDGRCSTDTLQALIRHGAHVDATRKDGTNALLRACATGQSESVIFLLEAGANANVVTSDVNTSLHVAVDGRCSKEALQKIIQLGVSVNSLNNYRETASLRACQSAQAEAVKLLLENGADPNIPEAEGFTSLHAAVQGCCTNATLQEIITHKADLNAQNLDKQTALFLACTYRQQDSVKILLEAGSNPNIASADGYTCLNVAVLQRCSKKMIRAIIDHGVDVNAVGKDNRTALILACEQNNADAINVLLNAGADTGIANTDGNTCLHAAVNENSSRDILQALIDHGADVNAENMNNTTPLMMACWDGNVDPVDALLNAGADPNITDPNGDSCIHFAVHGECSIEAIQAIVDHGADVNAANISNETALIISCENGNLDAISVLLNAGADPGIANATGDTCLHAAVYGGCSIEVLHSLLDHGADVNATNKNNVTALMIACLKGNADAIDALLNAKADTSIATTYGETLIHQAVMEDYNKEVLHSVINYGVDVNATNINNVTALMIACDKGNLDAINVLLNAGADPNITSGEGNWLHYAVRGDCSKEVLQAIIDHGADINATDEDNTTVLMKACWKGNVDSIHVLLNAGADPNMVDDIGATCLHYVTDGEDNIEDFQEYIDQYADVSEASLKKQTTLVLVCEKGDVFTVSVLLKSPTDSNSPDAKGDKLLHNAVHNHISEDLLQSVVDTGAEVYAVTDESAASQLVACNPGQRECTSLLLKAGADTSITNIFGDTCLHQILHREYLSLEYDHETLQMFLNHGAPVNAINKNHQTAYMLASNQGNIDAMCALLNAGADPNTDGEARLQCVGNRCSSYVSPKKIIQWLSPAFHYLDFPALEITESLCFNMVPRIIYPTLRYATWI